MPSSSTFDVAILGAGLSGLTLARQLALTSGKRILLLDRRADRTERKCRTGESTAPVSAYYLGKVLEILGLYFSEKKPDTEACPFLNDQETVRKIKHAKEYLLKHMVSPPGLKELAKTAGLNEYQLKVGFKEIYGNTVFGYLLEHKLDHSRVLLDSSRFQVNEVAYQIGYANPTHFIAAFKKKFGVTPKKYLMNLSRKVEA